MISKKKSNYSFNFFFDSKISYPKNINDLFKLCKKKYNTIGNLRSYNDAGIGKNPINLKNFNKVLNFNYKKRFIEVEAGIILNDLLNITLKKKLIIKSLPGSRYITLGGMIANNTLGKNINKGFIKNYLISLKVIHNGKIVRCFINKNKKLFLSTIGGKGTTGVIISAKLRLDRIPSQSIQLDKVFFKDIYDLKSKFLKIKKKEYVVAWIDNLSKNYNGIIFFASHQKKLNKKNKKKELIIPSIFIYLLNIISSYKIFTFIFNKIFKLNNYLRKRQIYNVFDFFFIQDTIKNWNEVFKKNGFFQFQFKCSLNDLNYDLKTLQLLLKQNGIFSNFMVVKFYKENNKIYNSVSLDIIKNSNYDKTCEVLNSFINKNNLNISLSKDSIVSKLNSKTIKSNKFLTYKKFDKNFESLFFTRIKSL